jgi:type IV secretory pathway VirB10-like protein
MVMWKAKLNRNAEELDQDSGHESIGGERFNRLLGLLAIAVAVIGGTMLALGLESSGINPTTAAQKLIDDPNSESRDRGEVADLAAHGATPRQPAIAMPAEPIVPMAQPPLQRSAPKPPSRFAQWAEDKYLKALEAPQMVAAFHAGSTLEINGQTKQSGGVATSVNPASSAVTLQRAASPYTVMAGNIIPAVLISGINSDLPGPILAQVSQNVLDSASGKYVLIPQGSRLIGTYQNANSYAQQRISIAWQRLIFPNTTSMTLPSMPGADQSGYAGLSDQVDHHYLATFGTAALISLISAGQQIGQMATFGGGGTYGPYGYTQPNQFAMAGEVAGSAASNQFGSLGQQMVGNGLNRPATIEIRPGYEFTVMVTQDLAFPGAYGK